MRATTTQMPRLLRANLDVWLEGEDRYLEKGPLSGWQDINCLCPHLDSVIITDICTCPDLYPRHSLSAR